MSLLKIANPLPIIHEPCRELLFCTFIMWNSPRNVAIVYLWKTILGIYLDSNYFKALYTTCTFLGKKILNGTTPVTTKYSLLPFLSVYYLIINNTLIYSTLSFLNGLRKIHSPLWPSLRVSQVSSSAPLKSSLSQTQWFSTRRQLNSKLLSWWTLKASL